VKLSVRYQLFAYLSCIARMTASPLAGLEAAARENGSRGSALERTSNALDGATSTATNATRDPMREGDITGLSHISREAQRTWNSGRAHSLGCITGADQNEAKIVA
jgi:ribosomal protein S28E/S33